MAEAPVPEAIISRLRANLHAAGIAATEHDIQCIQAGEFLQPMLAVELLLAGTPRDVVPDYLAKADAAVEPSRDTRVPPFDRPDTSAADQNAHPRPLSLAAAAELIRRRDVSPLELVRQALDAIAARDPQLNAFQVVLTEQALAAARRAEQEIASGAYRGPLHGLPIAVKDLLALRGTETTAGTLVLAGSAAGHDAAGVERLQEAGAVIVGKTRLSEAAYAPCSHNPHYGPTHNPWNLAYDTGGSSSGSAAAVAAGLVFAALGSDTGGSIRIPASFCGLVGFKPTFGRVSLFGVTPLAWSLDHLGPMARSVADVALLLEVLAGHDPRDPRTQPVSVPGAGRRAANPLPEYLLGGVQGLRIGVLRDDGTGQPLCTPEVLSAWQDGLAALRQAGANLVEIDVAVLQELRLVTTVTMVQEAIAFHEPLLRASAHLYGEFARRRLLAGYAYSPATFVRVQQLRASARRRANAIWEHVDLLSTPTMAFPATPVGALGASHNRFTSPFNALGWPAISIPVGFSAEGLPLGLQLVGQPWADVVVLRAAHSAELHLPDWGHATS